LDELEGGKGESATWTYIYKAGVGKGNIKGALIMGEEIKLTQARRVRLWRPSCWVISAGLMAF
jgi:hypothetical protein